MKRITLFLALLLTTATMMAVRFKIGKLIFRSISNTEVKLSACEVNTKSIYLNPTVTYEGVTYTVAEIDWNAFGGCSSLTAVTIPESVKRIGDGAFMDCSSLTSVTIPESVTEIAARTFYGCSSLISVTIPESVKSIGWGAFKGTAIYKNQSNWKNGALYINDCLIAVSTEMIGDFSVKTGTRLVASGAFQDCSSLTSVTILDSITEIADCVFWGCSSLTSVTIPESVTEIAFRAFEGCSSLTSITIPNSVTSIGGNAFAHCSSLTSVTIPEGVMRIGREAFKGTAIYKNQSNWENGALYINDCLIAVSTEMVGDFSVKTGTRLIAGSAFCNCSSLTSVTIPESVTSIGEWMFNGCSSLTSVTIPENVTEIEVCAFYDCSSLTSITIPNSVTSIGWGAFKGCGNLKTIYIPKGTKARFAAMDGLMDYTHLLVER